MIMPEISLKISE